jgi:hypothetical protein
MGITEIGAALSWARAAPILYRMRHKQSELLVNQI